MNLWESVLMALEGIWTNKLRSFLTMLGIVIGIAAVIAVVAIGQGGRALLMGEMEKMGSSLYVVFMPWDQQDGNSVAKGMTLDDIRVIKNLVPQVQGLAPSTSTVVKIKNKRGNKSIQMQIQGTTEDYSNVRNLTLAAGRFFSGLDVQAGRRVAVIDNILAGHVFGRDNPLGQKIMLGKSSAVVIGVVKKNDSIFEMGQTGYAYVPITFWRQMFGESLILQMEGKAVSKDQVNLAAEQTLKILQRRHPGLNLQTMTMEAQMATANKITGIMTLIVGAIAGISLFVGGIGVMNIMLVSVTERTREIGIRKALGAQRRDILIQFLIEAVTICLVGGLIGMTIGISGAFVIAKFAKWPPLVSWSTVAIAFAFSTAIGLFFGIYPANKAAKLDPIEAFRYE